MSTTVLIVLAILVGGAFIVALWATGIYNQLVTLKNRYQNAFSQIEVQLKRRYDLIPNLVETAKGYMAHERQTLEAVIAARNSAQSATQKAAAHPGDAADDCRGERPERRARTSVRAVGGLSGPEGQPEHDAGIRRADQHREQDC